MNEYYDSFLYDRSGMLTCTIKCFHENRTGDTLPIKNPYKLPFALKEELGKQLHMLQTGVITPTCSEWVAMILMKNKSLDRTPKYRFGTQFRGLTFRHDASYI
jgi:hypothetical protein